MTNKEAATIVKRIRYYMEGSECWTDAEFIAMDMAVKALEQPEIVRCKECKWYELPSHKITENCVRWMKSNGILLPIKPNDYCSYAERKTDECTD